jgi:hypothetical protein
MLFFAFWYAYSYYRASGRPAASAAGTCATTAPAAAAPRPADVTVNVYNATDRQGLAARTATDVRKRGFVVATVANDPLQRTVAGVAEVRFGASGVARAKVVLTLVKGAKTVRDSRPDGTVDLVLGEKFTALAPAPKTKPATKPTKAPTTGATPPATARPSATPTC